MGYDLFGKQGYIDFNITAWGMLFDLACEHGWEPAGTVRCVWVDKKTGTPFQVGGFRPADVADEDGKWVENREWRGTYFSNDGQEITDADALNLAAAVERALIKLPMLQRSRPPRIDDDPLTFWADAEGVGLLKKAVAFFKKGGCCII